MPYNVPEEEKPAFNKQTQKGLELLTQGVSDTLSRVQSLQQQTLVDAYNQPVQVPVTRDLTPLEQYVYEPQPVQEVADLAVPPTRESMVAPQEQPQVLSNFRNQANAQFGGDMVSITPEQQASTDIIGAEIDSLRNDAGEIASSPLEVFSKPLDANKVKALGFVDSNGNVTETGELFFNLKESGVFNEDGTINEKGQAYLIPRSEIGKPENVKAFKTWYDDNLDYQESTGGEMIDAVVGFGKNIIGGLYDSYKLSKKLTSLSGLVDVARQTVSGKETVAELQVDQIGALEQVAKNFQAVGGYADILQGLAGRALYEGAAAATGVPMQDMKDAAEENLYLARQRQWTANENLRDLEVGAIAEAMTGLDGFTKVAQEAKNVLGEEKFNSRYAGSSAITELVGDPSNLMPAAKAFKVATSAPIASRAIIKAQQILGKTAKIEKALNEAQTIVEAGNTILKKEAVAVPLAQRLFTDISARAGANPELLARSQQAMDVAQRITASADEVRAAMPSAIASVEQLTAKRASLATRIPEEYAKKVVQTAELGAKVRAMPANVIGSILERTGDNISKIDNAVTGYLSERGLDQAYNAALGAAGVVGLAGNPVVGVIGAGAAALKTGKFLTEYGKIFKYVGREMENARGQIPFWKRVAYHTAPKSLGQGLSHTFNIFELGGATSDILRRTGRGIVAAYPSDLFFEYLSDGGEMRPQTMTRAAAESFVLGGAFAAGGGAFMGTKQRMRELAIGDEINFRQGLVDTNQKARFEALPPVIKRSIATYSMANPTLNYNFIESGGSEYDPNSNTANINIYSTNPLKALVAHETLHHTIIKNNMEGGIAAMFLGDTKTDSVGGLFRSKGGKLDPEFEAFANKYYDRMRASGMSDAEIKTTYPLEKAAVEYFIEQHSDQYADMAESGELGAIAARGEVRKKLGSVLETILPKIPVLRDLHFKSGGAIDANGAFVTGVGILGDFGVSQNPIAKKMFREMNKRSSGMMPGQFEPLLSDKEGSGAPLFFDPSNEIDMEMMHPLVQVDANDKPILKDGRPIALAKEIDMNRTIAGLSIVEAYRKLRDSNYAPEEGEAYVDEDGEFKPGWVSDSVLTQMFAKHQFNNEQKRMIRQTNKMVKEGNGQRMVMINFPSTTRNKAGKVVYKTQGATIRDTVPVAITIGKDGQVLYGLMSVTKLQENIKKRAQSKRGKQLYSGNIDIILRDVQAMMNFHKKGEDSINWFIEKYGIVEADKRRKFINTMFGLLNKKEQAVLNPMLLEDGVKSSDNVYRTYRADRVSKAIPMSPDEYAAMPFSYEAVSQVRMPEQRQMPEAEAPAPSQTRFMPEGVDEDKFYSQLDRVITDKVPSRATPQQIMATIDPTRGSGVKAEEIKWSGIEQALASLEKDGKVSKEDLLNYLRNEGRVRFEEVTMKDVTADDIPQSYETKRQEEILRERAKERADEADTDPEDEYEEMIRDVSELQSAMEQARDEYLSGQRGPATKYAQYQLPGGENYREVVLAMPQYGAEEPLSFSYSSLAGGMRMATSNRGGAGMGATDQAALADWKSQYGETIKGTQKPLINTYTSSHFPDIPNYVAHMRTNERVDADGRPGLFVEEFQSDRHQEGRKRGYASDRLSNEEITSTRNEIWRAHDAGEIALDEMRQRLESLRLSARVVADAPFRTTWPLQLFKRALRDAVDSGKEWVGWTTGETQNDRFSLEKQLDYITHKPLEGYSDGSKLIVMQPINGGAITIGTDENGRILSGVGNSSAYDGKMLDEVIGKDVAERILAGAGEPPSAIRVKTGLETADERTLKGDDLKVQGTGMKGFYDNMLPKEIGKYVSKFKGKVEKDGLTKIEDGPIKIEGSDETGWAAYDNSGALFADDSKQAVESWVKQQDKTPIWKVSITPEMRQLAQGQMRFMPEGERKTIDQNIPEKEGGNMSPSTWDSLKKVGYNPEASEKTQIATTFPTYVSIVKANATQGMEVLDFSAGRGIGTKAMKEIGKKVGFNVEGYEPFSNKKTRVIAPEYEGEESINKIPDNSKDIIVNNAVLNVVPESTGRQIVNQIYSKLKPGGSAFISVMGWSGIKSRLENPKTKLVGPREVVTQKGTFQKGYTAQSLRSLIEQELPDAKIVRTSHGGIGFKVTKPAPPAETMPAINPPAKTGQMRFLPEPVEKLSAFKGKRVQVLTSDLSLVGDVKYGDYTAQFKGGPGYLDNDGWAFTDKNAADAFVTRWRKDGEPLIGLASLGSANHLNSLDARKAYAEKWKYLISIGKLDQADVDSHIKEAMSRIKSSNAKSVKADWKNAASMIENADDLSNYFDKIPWAAAPMFYEKLTAKTLPIKYATLVENGLDLESAAKEYRQPEFEGAELGDLYAIAEYDGSKPEYKPELNKAYPWRIKFKKKATLSQMHNVADLTTDPRAFAGLKVGGRLGAQPLMVTGINLDKLISGDIKGSSKPLVLKPETSKTKSNKAKQFGSGNPSAYKSYEQIMAEKEMDKPKPKAKGNSSAIANAAKLK